MRPACSVISYANSLVTDTFPDIWFLHLQPLNTSKSFSQTTSQTLFWTTNSTLCPTLQLDGQAPVVLVWRQDRVDRVYGGFPPGVTVCSNGWGWLLGLRPVEVRRRPDARGTLIFEDRDRRRYFEINMRRLVVDSRFYLTRFDQRQDDTIQIRRALHARQESTR